jgi:hypothetical protein
MTISNDRLMDIVVEVAEQDFGTGPFRRRPLMTAVEQRLRQLGVWTPEDEAPSSSAGTKSEGLAKIDWAISHLKDGRRLLNDQYDTWRLP